MAEPLATSYLDNLVNHGYLPVDFFFFLSGFVIGYAYDDCWPKMTVSSFLKHRIEPLQPMVVLGRPSVQSGLILQILPSGRLFIPFRKMLLVLLIGYTILPVPSSLDIRG
ncbi:hypothetical protein [Adhaeribacter swui]|uniref:hypothetical protein n=1 Tax=Adhaeribacter swui TaxID=2086471 RepID=UPI001E4F39E6|nr:hypothetical protein [Adhaeribacter swui]